MAPGQTPTVVTSGVTSISYNFAVVGGEVELSGGSTVTSRGVVWSVTTGATLTGSSYTSDGVGLGSFISEITGLVQNTKYYFRAYAVNSTGTGYGTEDNFTTLIQQLSSDNLRLYERTGIFGGGTPTPEEQLATIEANAIDLTENSIDMQD
jgi:hypothetical protein